MAERADEPTLRVEDPAGGVLGEVWVHVGVRFGTLQLAWDVGPLWADGPSLEVPLLVPGEAVMHPEQARYVTSLAASVRTQRGQGGTTAALVWPSGLDAPPEVWGEATVAERAPQGVLDPTLRIDPALFGASDRPTHFRLAAPVEWGPARAADAEVDR